MNETPIKPPRRAWLRIGLGASLVGVALAGLGLGWVAGARRQAAIARAIGAQGFCEAIYDDGSTVGSLGTDPRHSLFAVAPLPADRWWGAPAFLDRVLSRDAVRPIVAVQIGGDTVLAPPLTRERVVAEVTKLAHLRSLTLVENCVLDDAAARQVARLSRLEHLNFGLYGSQKVQPHILSSTYGAAHTDRTTSGDKQTCRHEVITASSIAS